MRATGQYRVCVHCLCKFWYSFLIKTLNKKVHSVSAVLEMAGPIHIRANRDHPHSAEKELI
jgi:hypothetical protein